MFENNDDFGIQEYRQDVDVLITLNSIQVKLLKSNSKAEEDLQGTFLGTEVKNHNDNGQLIYICINSSNSENEKLTREGYHGRGEVRFNCYAKYFIDVENKDTIEFITNYKYGIKKGDTFRIEMKETGVWQGQYTYKNFDIVQTQ